MNSGHQAFLDAKLLMNNLYQGSQAVGGAGSVGNNGHVLGVLVQVNAAHESGGLLILCGSGDNNLLSAALQVSGSLLGGAEHTGGLNNISCAALAPRNLSGIHLCIELDFLAVHDDGIIGIGNVALVLAMNGVIAQHVCAVVGGHERIVDTHEFDVRIVQTSTEYQAADAAKAIDAYFNSHRTNTS